MTKPEKYLFTDKSSGRKIWVTKIQAIEIFMSKIKNEDKGELQYFIGEDGVEHWLTVEEVLNILVFGKDTTVFKNKEKKGEKPKRGLEIG